ncbi:MAG TPA: hypothetical protein VKX39_12655 [Bryobacteraceae bacterium]|nr:hypothetical protein [Bryobacteraceae bacterium]
MIVHKPVPACDASAALQDLWRLFAQLQSRLPIHKTAALLNGQNAGRGIRNPDSARISAGRYDKLRLHTTARRQILGINAGIKLPVSNLRIHFNAGAPMFRISADQKVGDSAGRRSRFEHGVRTGVNKANRRLTFFVPKHNRFPAKTRVQSDAVQNELKFRFGTILVPKKE